MQNLLIGLTVVGIIAAIIVLILSAGNTWIILLGVFVMAASIGLGVFTLYNYDPFKQLNTGLDQSNIKLLSQKILKETDKELFTQDCDQLFKAEGDETYSQYLSMQKNRPQAEVNNLCGNLAKQKLNMV
jgi:hypothetical protein